MSTEHIKAIETEYAGCRFRSRLEARWAVFFDVLGITWEYEPNAYHIGFGGFSYLPDFWLPGTRTWVEVKGSEEAALASSQKLMNAVDYGCGLPETENSRETLRGLLILGPVPRVPSSPLRLGHAIMQHRKGVWVGRWMFTASTPLVVDAGDGWYGDATWGSGWDDPSNISCTGTVPLTECVDLRTYPYDGRLPAAVRDQTREDAYWELIQPMDRKTQDAYRAARSARFDHGHSGRD